MQFEAPAVIMNIKDIKAIYDMNDRQSLIADTESLEQDLFTGTATLNGIIRREKLYGISPYDTDSLEDRRYRVMAKENDRAPYTMPAMRRKLATLCGKDGYKFVLEDDRLTVKVELSKKNMFDDVCKLLENIVPLNVVLNVSLLYNQHKTLGKYTHKQLAAYTHKQLREDVIS